MESRKKMVVAETIVKLARERRAVSVEIPLLGGPKHSKSAWTSVH